jgi:hypothetical protein
MCYMELHQITRHSLDITLLSFLFFSGFHVQYGHTSFGVEPLYLFVIPTLMQLKGHK